MRARLRTWLSSGVVIAIVVGATLGTPIPAQAEHTLFRASVGSGGIQADGASGSGEVSIGGRYTAFKSAASNLVPGDTNGIIDIFVHDQLTAETVRVNAASDGTQGNDVDRLALEFDMTDDGRYVVFSSRASNLVPNDSDNQYDVFLRDLQTKKVTLVSVAIRPEWFDADKPARADPSISASGRFVTFTVYEQKGHSSFGVGNVFIRDLEKKTTSAVTAVSAGATDSSVSSNGRYVIFGTSVNGQTRLVWYNRETRNWKYVDAAHDGSKPTSYYDHGTPTMTPDGMHVGFASWASNLVPNDTNGVEDAFVRNIRTGITERVSVSSDEAQANYATSSISLSRDANRVVFVSSATLAPTVPYSDPGDYLYIRDRVHDTTSAFMTHAERAAADTGSPHISPEGRFVSFSSPEPLVSGDTNSKEDVFVHEMAPEEEPPDSTPPKMISASIDDPKRSDPLLQRGLTISSTDGDGSGVGSYEYGWAQGTGGTAPTTDLETVPAPAEGKSLLIDYGLTTPNSTWTLLIRAMDRAGNHSPWYSLTEQTPDKPLLIVLGDSVAAGHHRDKGEDITTCQDERYAYGQRVHSLMNTTLPTPWETFGYINLGYSGYTTAAMLSPEAEDDACGNPGVSDPVKRAEDLLEANQGSWTFVVITAGVNDTDFPGAIKELAIEEILVKNRPVVSKRQCRTGTSGWKGWDPAVRAAITDNVYNITKDLQEADATARIAWTSYYNFAGTSWLLPRICGDRADQILSVLEGSIRDGLDRTAVETGMKTTWIEIDRDLHMNDELIQPLSVRWRYATRPEFWDEFKNLGWPHPNRLGARSIGFKVARKLNLW